MNTLDAQKAHYRAVRRRLDDAGYTGMKEPSELPRTVSVAVPLRQLPPTPAGPKPFPEVSSRDLRRKILDAVSVAFDVSVGEIMGDMRGKQVVLARHAVFYELRKQGSFGDAKIGRLMNKDPTTVGHGIDRHMALMKAEKTDSRNIPDF